MNKNKKLRFLILTALFAAMTFVLTFSIKIPMPGGGYIHLGDTMIYLAASILPTPLAMLGAAIGGAMSDFAGGYTMFVLPTLIIKALICVPFTSKNEKIICKRNLLACVVSAVITLAGYYLTDVVLLAMSSANGFIAGMSEAANWAGGLPSIAGNTIQAVGSAILFIVIGLVFDKMNFKNRIKKMM